jgi:hypothetical protein
MRCFLGLLLCVFVVFGLSEVSGTVDVQVKVEIPETLECLECNSLDDGDDCASNGTKTVQCSRDAGYIESCRIAVHYIMRDDEWKVVVAVRGCSIVGNVTCYALTAFRDDYSAICQRVCDSKRCNVWPIPSSPTSDEWGSLKLVE